MSNEVFKNAKGEKIIMDCYDAVLKLWPVVHEFLRIPTSQGETFVIASGDVNAPPLVLLHGTSSNSALFLGDIENLSSKFRVYAVDIIGEAGKSAPVRPPLKGDAHCRWLEDVLNELGVEKAVLVGNSMGGWVSLDMAVRRPERVQKLILLAPSGLVPGRKAFFLKAVPLLLLGDWGMQQINEMIYHKAIVPPEVLEFGALVFEHFKFRMEDVPGFSDEELSSLKMPVRLMVGEKDELLDSQGGAARLGKLLPGARIEILKDVGHVVLDKSQEILEFALEGVEPLVPP